MSVNFLKAIHMETDPQTISAYLIYLSQHAPVEEQASHNDLALVITASCLSFHMSLCFKPFFLSMSSADMGLVSLLLSAGHCPAHRRAFNHHEQPLFQTLQQT